MLSSNYSFTARSSALLSAATIPYGLSSVIETICLSGRHRDIAATIIAICIDQLREGIRPKSSYVILIAKFISDPFTHAQI